MKTKYYFKGKLVKVIEPESTEWIWIGKNKIYYFKICSFHEMWD